MIVDDSPSEVSSCDGWLPEDEFVGPDHPDWDKATPLEMIDPTNVNKLQLSPSRPSSPRKKAGSTACARCRRTTPRSRRSIGKVEKSVLDLEAELAQFRADRPKAGWVVLRDLQQKLGKREKALDKAKGKVAELDAAVRPAPDWLL